METRKTSVIRRAAALLCALVLAVGLAPVQVLADAGRIETLYVGESRTLEQTGAASWESSSDETATVTADETDSDKAVVTAEAAGDVTIKALGGDGSELQAWEFRVKERSVHINKVSDTYCVAADAAPTMTVTMDGVGRHKGHCPLHQPGLFPKHSADRHGAPDPGRDRRPGKAECQSERAGDRRQRQR